MRSRFSRTKSQTFGVERVVCAVIFLLFAFCWLYFFQADMLALAQHGLSGGKTHYDRTVGALIITGVLMVVQLLVSGFTRLSRGAHALTYVPSFLLLTFISSLSGSFTLGAWPWMAALVLALWGGAVWLAKKMASIDKQPRGLFTRRTWVNLLQMAAMMLIVAALSNTNAVSHYKAHAEVALMQGDTDEALRAGRRSWETDPSLTMLRIMALSQQGLLADTLFSFAVSGTSADMLPLAGSESRLQLMPDSLLWKHLGLHPDSLLMTVDSATRLQSLTAADYLDSMARRCKASAAFDSLVGRTWRDYQLMGQLIDRRLSAFVEELPQHYVVEADSLPRHYREALMLYQQRFDTLFIYSDSLMLQQWRDYCHYDTLYALPSERRVRAEGDFRTTYWFYFDRP